MQKLLRLLENNYKYLIAVILMVVPLYPKFPLIKIPGTYVAIRLEDFIILFALLYLMVLLRGNISWLVKGKYQRLIALFLIASLISVVSGIFLTKTVVPHIGLLHLVRRIEYFLPFLLGLYLIKNNKKSMGFIMKVLLFVVLLIFMYGYGQRHLSWPIFITQNMEYAKGLALRWIPGSHINSTFAGHYDLATFLVMALPILVSLFVILKDLKTRIIVFIVFLSGLWLLVNAISRISVVSYLIAITSTLILIKKYKYIPIFILISLIFFGQSLDLLTRYKRVIIFGRQKIENVIYNTLSKEIYAMETSNNQSDGKFNVMSAATSVVEDRSFSIRLNVEWPRALRAFYKNPLLGTGFSSITLATDNDYLRLLGEVGMLGFLSFMVIIFYFIKEIMTLLPIYDKFSGINLAFISGFTGSIPGLLLNAFFIDIFEASKFAIIFWLFFGMTIGMINNAKRLSEDV